jgi:hypothetical protein
MRKTMSKMKQDEGSKKIWIRRGRWKNIKEIRHEETNRKRRYKEEDNGTVGGRRSRL